MAKLSYIMRDDVPEIVKPSAAQIAAWFTALQALFKEYRGDDKIAEITVRGQTQPAAYCRRRALTEFPDQPRISAYWACDTGVPNDLILATYRLVFDLERDDDAA